MVRALAARTPRRGPGTTLLSLLALCALCALPASAQSFEYFVSTDDGNDDEGCGASAERPCKSLKYVSDTYFVSPIGQYHVNFAPGVYAGSGNTHLLFSNVALVLLRPTPSSSKADSSGVVFDCTNGAGETTACFEHRSSFGMVNVEVQGTVSSPVIRSLAPSVACELDGVTFHHLHAPKDTSLDEDYLALIEGVSGSGARTMLKDCTFKDLTIPLAFLSNKHALDMLRCTLEDCASERPLPFMELDSGPDGKHVLNCQRNTFRNLTGWASIMRYSPAGERGTMVLNENEFKNNAVTDAMIHFEGASLLASTNDFEDNSGLWTFRMIQIEKKLGAQIELSWDRGRVVNSPTIEIEDGIGWFRDTTFARTAPSDDFVPALLVRNPVDLQVNEIVVQNYTSSNPGAGLSLVAFEGAASSYEVDVMQVTLAHSVVRDNVGYVPVSVSSTDTRGSLAVHFDTGIFEGNENAGGEGGAIAITQVEENTLMSVQISGTAFFGNAAASGGAVFCSAHEGAAEGSEPFVHFAGESLGFNGNTASKAGGDVYVNPASPCTVACSAEVEFLCEELASDDSATISVGAQESVHVDGFVVASLVIGVLVLFVTSLGSALMAVNVFLRMRREVIAL